MDWWRRAAPIATDSYQPDALRVEPRAVTPYTGAMKHPAPRATVALLLTAVVGCTPNNTGDERPADTAGLEATITATGPLSYVAEFSTDALTAGEVRYWPAEEGADPASWFFMRDGTPAPSHRIPIHGLEPGRSYRGTMMSMDGAFQRGFTIETPGILPVHKRSEYTPELEDFEIRTMVRTEEPSLLEANTTMFMNLLFPGEKYTQVIGWNRAGSPVWTHVMPEETAGGSGDVDVTVVGDCEDPQLVANACRALLIGGGLPAGAHLMELGFDHSIRYSGPEQGSFMGEDHFMHHSARKWGDSYLTMTSIQRDQDAGISDWLVLHDRDFDPIGSGDPTEGVLWDLVVSDELGDLGYFESNLGITDDGSTVYVYSRSENLLVGIDRETKAVAWVLGERAADMEWDPETTVIDTFVGGEPDWFYGAHGFETRSVSDTLLDILVHDNAITGDNPNGAEGSYSRAVEYRIDTNAATVQLLWAYPSAATEADADLYVNPNWGDVHYHGQNVVLFSGARSSNTIDELPEQTAIIELRPDYETNSAVRVWSMLLEAETDEGGTVTAGLYSGHPTRDLYGEHNMPAPEQDEAGAWRSFAFSSEEPYDTYGW